jgi:hypothetical protein
VLAILLFLRPFPLGGFCSYNLKNQLWSALYVSKVAIANFPPSLNVVSLCRFSQVTQAVTNGINEIVNNLAEYGDEDSGHAHSGGYIAGSGGSGKGHHASGADRGPLDDANVRLVIKPDATGKAVVHVTKATNKTAAKPEAKPAAPAPDGKKGKANRVTVEEPEVAAPSPTLEFDPLSGVLGPSNVSSAAVTPTAAGTGTSTAVAAPVSAPPDSPVLTGKGTSYKNMPAEAMPPTAEDSSAQAGRNQAESVLTSPTITGYHIRSKIMNNGWFPSTAKKERRKEKKREHRSSGGVNLHVLHSSAKGSADAEDDHGDSSGDDDSDGQGSDSKDNSERLHKKTTAGGVDRNAVGDRLLDLADTLVHPAYVNLPAALTAGRELDYEVEMRRETVKQLRAMADVLAGMLSIEAFDAKFGKPRAPSPVTPKKSPMPPTSMSPLPPVPEERSSTIVAAVVDPQLSAVKPPNGARAHPESDVAPGEEPAASRAVGADSLSSRPSDGAATAHEETALMDTMNDEGHLLASMSHEDAPVDDAYWG